jgi:hypothetical protein
MLKGESGGESWEVERARLGVIFVSVSIFSAGFPLACGRNGIVSSSDSGPSTFGGGDVSEDTKLVPESATVGDTLDFDTYSLIPLCFWSGPGSNSIGHSGPQYVTSGRVEGSAAENRKLYISLQALV